MSVIRLAIGGWLCVELIRLRDNNIAVFTVLFPPVKHVALPCQQPTANSQRLKANQCASSQFSPTPQSVFSGTQSL